MSTHRCPGPGCEVQVPAEMLWAAYRALQTDPGVGGDPIAREEEHDQAIRAAIAEMKP